MLYVIGTPIGNLQDITIRAIEVMKSLDILICENRLKTLKILTHYEITAPKLVDHGDFESIKSLLLEASLKIGLVVEAGTPGISDPGTKILEFAHKNNVQIACIPGVSAVTAALSICPLDFDDFIFIGFLPKKPGKLKKILAAHSQTNIVAFESPHRIIKTLEKISEIYPDKQLFIARELTKVFESSYLDTAKNLVSKVIPKGEFALLIPKS